MISLSLKIFGQVGCGSTGYDASNEWSFGGPDKEGYVRVPDIY